MLSSESTQTKAEAQPELKFNVFHSFSATLSRNRILDSLKLGDLRGNQFSQ